MAIAFLAAFFCICSIAVAIFCFDVVVQYLPPFLTTQLEITVALFLIGTWLVVGQQLSFMQLFTLPSLHSWGWMALAGIANFIGGNYYSLVNIKLTNTANNSLLSPVITVVTSLLAIAFLNEHIGYMGFVGLLLTVIAVWAYQYRQLNISAISKQGFISGWICVACISVGIICAIKGSMGSNISLFHSMFIRLFAVFPMVVVLQLLGKQRLTAYVKNMPFKIGGYFLAAIILQTILGTYCWFVASFAIGIARFQVLIALLPFVVACINALIHKTKPLTIRFFITAFLAFVGVLLLYWQNV